MTEYEQLLYTLGAKDQSEAMAEIGRLHGIARSVEIAQVATAAEADFESNTFSFDVVEWTVAVYAGPYALVRLQPNT